MASRAPVRLVEDDEPMAIDSSDDQLMLQVAAGRRDAFRVLVERHEAHLLRYCAFMAATDAEAREITQDVFLKLWSIRARYRGEGRLRALLFTMARNRCRTLARRHRYARWFGTLVMAEPTLDPTLDDPVERQEQFGVVGGALRRLPEHFRTPLLLRFVEELPYDDIARIIGRTPSTARSRVHYGLKKLAESLPGD